MGDGVRRRSVVRPVLQGLPGARGTVFGGRARRVQAPAETGAGSAEGGEAAEEAAAEGQIGMEGHKDFREAFCLTLVLARISHRVARQSA